MKETLRRNHSRSRSNSITHFSSIDELQESSSFSHVLSSGYSDISSVLDHVHHELKKLGVNGMLELLQEMRTLQNPSGELSTEVKWVFSDSLWFKTKLKQVLQ